MKFRRVRDGRDIAREPVERPDDYPPWLLSLPLREPLVNVLPGDFVSVQWRDAAFAPMLEDLSRAAERDGWTLERRAAYDRPPAIGTEQVVERLGDLSREGRTLAVFAFTFPGYPYPCVLELAAGPRIDFIEHPDVGASGRTTSEVFVASRRRPG
jgi:hypothetical protein